MVLGTLLLVSVGSAEAQDRRGDTEWWAWAVADLLSGEEVRASGGRSIRIGPRDRYHRDRFVPRDRHRDRFGPRDRYRSDRYRDRARRGGHGHAKGPAFCRSGRGHPVFGRRWCHDKGFGLGWDGWRRGDLGDIIFRRYPRRHGSILDHGGVEEILGEIILGRLLDGGAYGRTGRSRTGRITGRWLELADPGARVLQVRSDGRALAELSDLDRDGRVDVLLLVESEP